MAYHKTFHDTVDIIYQSFLLKNTLFLYCLPTFLFIYPRFAPELLPKCMWVNLHIGLKLVKWALPTIQYSPSLSPLPQQWSRIPSSLTGILFVFLPEHFSYLVSHRPFVDYYFSFCANVFLSDHQHFLLYLRLVWCLMTADKSWNWKQLTENDFRLIIFLQMNSYSRGLFISVMNILLLMVSNHLTAHKHARFGI